MKVEVLELLKSTKSMLQLKVVAGGLAPVYNSSMVETPRRKGRGQQKMNQEKRMSQEMIVMRYEKARLFHSKVDIVNLIITVGELSYYTIGLGL